MSASVLTGVEARRRLWINVTYGHFHPAGVCVCVCVCIRVCVYLCVCVFDLMISGPFLADLPSDRAILNLIG